MEQATQAEQDGQAMVAIIAAFAVKKTSADYTGIERTVPLEISVIKAKFTSPKLKVAVSLGGIMKSIFPIT